MTWKSAPAFRHYPGLFAELKKAKWDGVMAIETDNQGFAEGADGVCGEGGEVLQGECEVGAGVTRLEWLDE